MEKPTRKVFTLDGGAGRILCAIPALKKYARLHPDEDFRVIVWGWDTLLWSIPELQDRVHSIDQKGLFNELIKDSIIVSPEPYRQWSYYNQKKSLAQVFDEIINETDNHSDLELPKLQLCKTEEVNGLNVVNDVKAAQQKEKTIIIQPFGRGARNERGIIVDDETRSLEHPVYLKLAEKLAANYNLILFAEPAMFLEADKFTFKVNTDIRTWAGIINAADYFVGCDSLGQHIARGLNKPGTVIMGSTFVINTTYPDWFNIIENEKIEKTYSPIRILNLDSHLANRKNDRLMDFDEEQLEKIYKSIVSHLENNK
jgi:hypothetical protein